MSLPEELKPKELTHKQRQLYAKQVKNFCQVLVIKL